MAIMSNNLCLGLDQAAKNLQEALSGTSNPMAIGLRGEGTGFYHSSVRQPQDPAQVGVLGKAPVTLPSKRDGTGYFHPRPGPGQPGHLPNTVRSTNVQAAEETQKGKLPENPFDL
ncbi:hypothetical protein PCANC_07603 [Puccinia coronata f. sp. avenae]|uniref:Uncharacterized protein n=1 Tax=Puccinia coronata f. sp. avenae TaxID=200324 RepID=A0A2N5VKB5_9BASI|nr:hypothetical protein PCANC_07603 [Puccinia coronata f. sp. avenae]